MNDDFPNAENIDFEKRARHGVGGEQLSEILNSVGLTVPNDDGELVIAEQYLNDDGTVNEQALYTELSALIASGKEIIKSFRFLDASAEGVLAGMSSVLGELRQMIAEFAKIHDRYIKLQHSLKLEEFKEASKLRLMERKHQMDLEKIRLMKGADDEASDSKKEIFDRARILKLLSEQKSKQELQNGNEENQ